ncbi:MAG: ABC transporter family substrate-binding protein, partial [Bowdeniella nasicola]|nr:ABC transporter family substrate-binding protein [Bowdeniella nasicola]
GSGDDGVASDASQINVQPRDALKDGGELKLPIGPIPTNWNPMHVDGNLVDNNDIMGFTMPALWKYNPDATTEPNEDYLTDFEVKDADGDDPMVVTLHLNPEAKWNDGTPITYKDFDAPFKACNGENTTDDVDDEEAQKTMFVCASSDGWREIEKIEQGEAESDVVVTFKTSYPDWTGVLLTPYHAEGMKDAETFNKGWIVDVPNNDWMAGPFKFESVDQSQKRVYLVPNENWWGNEPILDKVTFNSLEADAQANSFANGEIDVLPYIIDASTYQTVTGREDAEVRVATGRQWRHYTFNSNVGLIQDQTIRQAIAMGLNREQTTKSDLAGLPVDPEKVLLGNHFFMPGQEGYADNSDVTPYDPEQAGKLLDEAGWTLEDGKEFRTNEAGEELAVNYLVITGVSTSENEGKMLQDQMKAIGINVKMVQASPNEFFSKVASGEFEITTFTWQGTPYPMANVGQIYGDGSSSNYANLKIDKVEELIPQIASEMDNDKRIELTNEADRAIWEAVHTVPIYQRLELTAVPKNLANYGAFGFASGKPEDIGYMK